MERRRHNALMNSRAGSGRIEIIQGSMFSGKTEELIARLRAAQRDGLSVRAFKHHIDSRYDPDHLITHRHDRFDALRVADAAAIQRHAHDANVVGVDEGHFFGLDLVEVTCRLAAGGRRIIIVGLEHDAWGRPFTPMPELAAIAVEVICKYAPCRVCGRPAIYSQRMVPVHDRTMVGGCESYEPRCQQHFQPLAHPPIA
jgi:thymidine kinase